MEFTAIQIANLLNGSVNGDENSKLTILSKIEDAQEGSLTFLANGKYESLFYSTKASAALVHRDFVPKQEIQTTLIYVDDVYASLTKLMEEFAKAKKKSIIEISSLAFIHSEASVGENVGIGAYTLVGKSTIGKNSIIASHVHIDDNCLIGENVVLAAGVKIYEGTVIQDNVIVHANTVIGSDGFGFNRDENGEYIKMQQLGNVIIEENVEIGANCVVDRASMGSTVIKKGVKLDNLIQVGHNVEIGENTVMAAQSGIAGSSKVGKNCLIGGQVGIIGHLKIGDGAQIQGQSGVVSNIKKENAKLYGTPAIDYSTYLRAYVAYKDLPDMAKKLRELEKEIADLKSKND